MHIAHLARAENELLASPLEDELRFVHRDDVRGAVVLLRQLLLALHHFARKANDHVVLIGLSVNSDGSECGAFDLHGLILVLFPILRDTLNGMRAMPSLQGRRGAYFFADRWRRLRNDIGDLPIGAHSFRMQPSNCDALDFAAAEDPAWQVSSIPHQAKPCFWLASVAVFFFASWAKARKLGSVTSSHLPERRLNVRFMFERH